MENALTAMFIFMLLGSIIAIETKSILSSVIALGVVGFASSVVYLFLAAPDIAITQVVVEVMSLIILIRAVDKAGNIAMEKRTQSISAIFALVFIGFFLSFSWIALKETPLIGLGGMNVANYYLRYAITEVKAANVVSAIILDYRAYDTFGEAVVLFTSILGALTLLNPFNKKEKINKGS